MQVEQFLEDRAQRDPDKIAVVAGDRRCTYAQLDEQANRFAHALIEAGLQRWDRVGIYLDNSVEAVVAIFGVLKARGVFVVINSQARPEHAASVLGDSGSVVAIVHARTVEVHGSDWLRLPDVHTVFAVGATVEGVKGARVFPSCETTRSGGPSDVSRPPARNIDVDLAALIYTSGSTGKPKGAMLTHLNMVSAARSVTEYLENTSADVILNFLPLAFSYGLYQVLTAFLAGGTVVLERCLGYPHEIVRTLQRERVTGLPLVPTAATILLQLDLSRYDLSRLRYITNAAAPLPPGRIRQLRAALPHVRLYSMYGLTECKRVSYLPPDQIDIRPTSVGRGMPNEEVYIVDDCGRRVAPGVVGELVVRGAHVMQGYWRQPEATAEVLRPGPFPGERVLHTGDLFRMDDEGYLYFVGRKDDMIKTRGEKVSPLVVERIISLMPGIADVAVYGLPDDVLGQAVVAAVTPNPGATLTVHEIKRHCAQHLEPYMVPRLVEIRESLPLTGSGKIDRRALRTASAGAAR